MTPTIGKRIDRYFDVRAKRMKLEKEAAKIKDGENKVKDDIIELMNQAKLESAKGTKGSVSVSTPEVSRADDWPAIFKWILRTKNFTVLSPRLNNGNIVEIMEHDPKLAKKGIPGISHVKVTKFTATAKKGA